MATVAGLGTARPNHSPMVRQTGFPVLKYVAPTSHDLPVGMLTAPCLICLAQAGSWRVCVTQGLAVLYLYA